MKQRKPWRKNAWARVPALVLCLALLLSGTGCGRGQEEGQSSGSAEPSAAQTGETVSGRYVENQRTLPETGGALRSLSLVGDTLYLQGTEGCWKSGDRGETWEAFEVKSALADQLEAEDYRRDEVAFDQDGGYVIPMRQVVIEETCFYDQMRYILVDKDGKERELEIRLPGFERYTFPGMEPTPVPEAEQEGDASALTELTVLPDGSLVGVGMSHHLYHVDQNTGEILHTVEPGGYQYADPVTGIAATPTCLLVTTTYSARLFDLETWEERDDTAAINQFMLEDGEVGADGHVSYFGTDDRRRYFKIFSDGKEEAFYFVDSKGLYRYMPGGVSIERLMDAPMSILSMQDTECVSFAETEDHSFLVLFRTKGESAEDYTYSFYSYTFDSDAIVKPAQELKIYSIHSSETIEQAVAVFQREHKDDFYVTYEEGISWGVIEPSDALRLLNTEIMADKGPDILVLDGMPVENYQNKGLLVDITDVVEEAAAENDLLRNITDIYGVDGKLYAVPASFTMPVVIGDREVLDKIDGLDSFAQTVRELREADKEIGSITGYRFSVSIIDSTFGLLSPEWLKNGAADWDIVGDYFDQVKMIFDADNNTETVAMQGDGTAGNPWVMESPIYMANELGLAITQEHSAIELRELGCLNGLPTLYGVMDEHPNITWKVLEDKGGCGFEPSAILGVNARSSHQEEAKEFIKLMLGLEMQRYDTNSNSSDTQFPVNFDAVRAKFEGKEGESFTEEYYVLSSDGEFDYMYQPLTKRNPTVAELEEFRAMTQKLNRVSPGQESVVRQALLMGCAYYFDGDENGKQYTREEALQVAREKIELYLAES